MKKLWVVLAVLALTHIWLLTGCGDDDDGGDADVVDSDTSQINEFHCNQEDFYTVENGNMCHDDYQCKSRFCEAWSSIPVDPDARCVDAPADETQLRYMATVVDFETREPIPNVQVRAAPALLTQTQKRNVKPTQTKISDEKGRVEMFLVEGDDLTDPLAEVVMADHEGYYFTATGVVEKNPPNTTGGPWPEGSATNNMLLVSLDLVSKLQTAMAADPDKKDISVLGTDGGAMGRVFQLSDGKAIEGVVLESRTPADKRGSIVLYPNADNTGFQDSTSSTGMFLIFFAGAGEKFDLFKDGVQISTPWDEGTTGSTSTLIFAMDMWVDDLTWCDNIPVDIDKGI